VVTVTSTVRASAAGEVAVIDVSSLTTKSAGIPPKSPSGSGAYKAA
jgi:hypothetical protein